MKTNYCTVGISYMKKNFKILTILVFINLIFLNSAASNSLKNTKCEIVQIHGTVCRVSEDRVVTRLESLNDTTVRYIKGTDTVVTVDKNSRIVLSLDNVKLNLPARTKLHFKKIVTLEKTSFILCSLIQGRLSLESVKNCDKPVTVIIDTKDSTIVTSSDKCLKFSVMDTGKVTVQQGIVDIYKLNDWTETNFMDKMLQRELLKSVTTGESGFFRYPSYPVLKDCQNDFPENSSNPPTREPTKLPKNNKPYTALPVNNSARKIQVEDKN